MTTDYRYFVEKLSTARSYAADGSREMTANVWFEVSLVWRTAQGKPQALGDEHDTIETMLLATESLGPNFGGGSKGVYLQSLQVLPDDEFESLRKRTLRFIDDAIAWAESVSGSGDEDDDRGSA
jgi:hypothetical protein